MIKKGNGDFADLPSTPLRQRFSLILKINIHFSLK